MKKIISLFALVLAMTVVTSAQTRYASALQFMQNAKVTVPGIESNSASSRVFDFSSTTAQGLFFSPENKFVVSDFPVGMNESKTVELSNATSVFDGRTHIYKMVNGRRVEVPIPQSRCLAGTIKDEAGSRVLVIMTGDEMYSSIERGSGTMLQICPAPSRKNAAILQDNTHGQAIPFRCGFENLLDAKEPIDMGIVQRAAKANNIQATELKECNVAIETDRFLWAKMGKDEARITKYLYTIFATVSWIYEREVNATFVIGDVIIHTDADPDPYTQNAKGDIGALLGEFADNWRQNYTVIKRTIAVLFTVPGVTDVGGIAYLNTLCTNRGFACCGIQTTSAIPTQGYQWDSFVTAHEIGHTFGAKHTHDCSWNPPIDSCVSTTGSIPTGDACWHGTPKPSKGSIMSYCHLFFPPPRYTFLPQVAAVVRAGADAASCMKVPTKATIKLTQPIGGVDQTIRSDTGVSVEWTSAKVTNVNIEYSLDAGATFNVINEAINLPATNRSYKWFPPAGTASNKAMIRIFATSDKSVADTSYAVFSMGAPTLTIKSFSGGERIGRKTTETVTWERTLLTNNRLEFSATGTDPWTTVLSDTTLTSYQWKVPDIEATNARLRVTGGSNHSLISMSGAFAIGTPTLTLVSPQANDSACVGTKYKIQWQSDFVRNVDIRYSRNNGSSFPLSQVINGTADANTQSFMWTVPTNKNTDSAIIKITNVADANQVVMSGRISIKVCAGVNSVNETPEMNGVRIAKISPTPANDHIVLTIQNSRASLLNADIQIYSAEGRSVLTHSMPVQTGEQQYSLGLESLSSGHYLIVMRTDGAELSLPFVVAR